MHSAKSTPLSGASFKSTRSQLVKTPSTTGSKSGSIFGVTAKVDSGLRSSRGSLRATSASPAASPAASGAQKTPRSASVIKGSASKAAMRSKPATPASKASTPVSKTPGGKSATPGSKVASPAAEVATPATKGGTPASKVATPGSKAPTPATKVSSPVASVVTPANGGQVSALMSDLLDELSEKVTPVASPASSRPLRRSGSKTPRADVTSPFAAASSGRKSKTPTHSAAISAPSPSASARKTRKSTADSDLMAFTTPAPNSPATSQLVGTAVAHLLEFTPQNLQAELDGVRSRRTSMWHAGSATGSSQSDQGGEVVEQLVDFINTSILDGEDSGPRPRRSRPPVRRPSTSSGSASRPRRASSAGVSSLDEIVNDVMQRLDVEDMVASELEAQDFEVEEDEEQPVEPEAAKKTPKMKSPSPRKTLATPYTPSAPYPESDYSFETPETSPRKRVSKVSSAFFSSPAESPYTAFTPGSQVIPRTRSRGGFTGPSVRPMESFASDMTASPEFPISPTSLTPLPVKKRSRGRSSRAGTSSIHLDSFASDLTASPEFPTTPTSLTPLPAKKSSKNSRIRKSVSVDPEATTTPRGNKLVSNVLSSAGHTPLHPRIQKLRASGRRSSSPRVPKKASLKKQITDIKRNSLAATMPVPEGPSPKVFDTPVQEEAERSRRSRSMAAEDTPVSQPTRRSRSVGADTPSSVKVPSVRRSSRASSGRRSSQETVVNASTVSSMLTPEGPGEMAVSSLGSGSTPRASTVSSMLTPEGPGKMAISSLGSRSRGTPSATTVYNMLTPEGPDEMAVSSLGSGSSRSSQSKSARKRTASDIVGSDSLSDSVFGSESEAGTPPRSVLKRRSLGGTLSTGRVSASARRVTWNRKSLTVVKTISPRKSEATISPPSSAGKKPSPVAKKLVKSPSASPNPKKSPKMKSPSPRKVPASPYTPSAPYPGTPESDYSFVSPGTTPRERVSTVSSAIFSSPAESPYATFTPGSQLIPRTRSRVGSTGPSFTFTSVEGEPQTPPDGNGGLIQALNERRSSRSSESPRLAGVKELVKTPGEVAASPKLKGVKKMVKTPKSPKSPRVAGIRGLMTEAVGSVLSPELKGVRELVKTPKPQKSPRVSGVRSLVRSAKNPPTPRYAGVKKMMRTPRSGASPRGLGEIRKMFHEEGHRSPVNANLKKLFKTPQTGKSPIVANLKRIMRTPHPLHHTPRLSGVQRLFEMAESEMAALAATQPESPVTLPAKEHPLATPKATEPLIDIRRSARRAAPASRFTPTAPSVQLGSTRRATRKEPVTPEEPSVTAAQPVEMKKLVVKVKKVQFEVSSDEEEESPVKPPARARATRQSIGKAPARDRKPATTKSAPSRKSEPKAKPTKKVTESAPPKKTKKAAEPIVPEEAVLDASPVRPKRAAKADKKPVETKPPRGAKQTTEKPATEKSEGRPSRKRVAESPEPAVPRKKDKPEPGTTTRRTRKAAVNYAEPSLTTKLRNQEPEKQPPIPDKASHPSRKTKAPAKPSTPAKAATKSARKGRKAEESPPTVVPVPSSPAKTRKRAAPATESLDQQVVEKPQKKAAKGDVDEMKLKSMDKESKKLRGKSAVSKKVEEDAATSPPAEPKTRRTRATAGKPDVQSETNTLAGNATKKKPAAKAKVEEPPSRVTRHRGKK